jgi:hypothetical protein
MKRCVSITCDFDLAIGKVNLNEIVYKLKDIRDSLMLGMLKQILMSYDDLIMDRLTRTKIYTSKMRKGLGQPKNPHPQLHVSACCEHSSRTEIKPSSISTFLLAISESVFRRAGVWPKKSPVE